MTSYRRGKHWEYKAAAMLKAQGYLVTASGGSLGMFDLIAIGAEGVRCCQIKGGARPWCSPADRAAIAAAAVPANVTKEVWYFTFDKQQRPGTPSPPPCIVYL